MTDPEWATWTDEQLLAIRLCDLELSIAGTEVEQHIAQLNGELEARGLVPPALLALRRVVHAGRRAGRRDSVLPRAPAAREARAGADARGRRRRPRVRACGSCATRPGTRSTTRTSFGGGRRAGGCSATRHAVSRVLHAEAVQQELRAAPRSLVRAEPSRRGLRRDVRRVARSGVDVGDALRGLAGAAEARIHGPADARAGAHAPEGQVEARSGSAARGCARRSASTTARSASTTASTIPTSTRAICATCSPMRPQYAKNPSAARFVRRIRKDARSHGGELHRQLPVHDRSAAREDHRALPRAEPAADRLRGSDQDRLHGVPHRPDDELPAQRHGTAWRYERRSCASSRWCTGTSCRPTTIPEGTDLVSAPWRTEYDVITTLDGDGPRSAAARRPRRPRRHPPRRRRNGSRTSPSTCSKGSTTSPSSTRTSSATWSC